MTSPQDPETDPATKPAPESLRRFLHEGLDYHCPSSEEDVRRLATELGLHRGSRVLELGCGAARTACQLAREIGCQVVATDLDPLFLDLALQRVEREGLSAHVTLRACDLRSLFAFFPGERFDAVFAEGSLAGYDLGEICSQVHALLDPEGAFSFSMLTWRPLDDPIPEETERAWTERGLPPGPGENGSLPIPRLEPTLSLIADHGFRKGFVYEASPAAWEVYVEGLRLHLEQMGARGLRSAEADRLFAGVRTVYERGATHVGWYVYGGYPDRG